MPYLEDGLSADAHAGSDVGVPVGTAHVPHSSDQLLRAIGEASASLIYATDLDGRFIFANRSMERLFGLEEGAFLGKTREPFMPAEICDQHRANDLQVLESGEALTFEETNEEADGVHTYLSVKSPLKDSHARIIGIVGISTDITETKRAQLERDASELRYSTLFRTAPDAILISRLSDGGLVEVNEAFTALSGYTVADLSGSHVGDIGFRDNPAAREELQHLFASGQDVHGFKTELTRKDGSRSVVLISARLLEIEGEPCVISITTDVSELAAAEERIEALSRVYAVLSGVNAALVRLREPQGIFDEACRIIVEEGEFPMAWVGLIAPDGKRVEPVAHAGAHVDYLETANVLAGDAIRGAGPTGLAIAERRHVIAQDIEHDPAMAPWRDQALAHGFGASASFPLIVNSSVVGAFTIYACDPHSFDDEQIALLDELAEDVAFALEFAEREQQRKLTEERLGESERWLNESQRIAHLGHYVYDVQRDWWDGSSSLYELLGVDESYRRDSDGWLNTVAEVDRDRMARYFAEEVLGKHLRFDMDYRIHRPSDGTECWVHGLGTLEFDEDGQPVRMFGVIQDVTERRRYDEQLGKSFSSLIHVVGELVETRDPYTAGHQRRVSELAVRIAQELDMPASTIEEIRTAALIHDVGKMSVPAEMLTKPGVLTSTELSIIRTHAEAGYRIIASAEMEGPIAEIVYQHHERCDGSGYPRGLRENELLPGSKVVMVADVVEAMVSHRPYRPGLGVALALREIEAGAGGRYDADVCKACHAVFHEGRFTFSASASDTPE